MNVPAQLTLPLAPVGPRRPWHALIRRDETGRAFPVIVEEKPLAYSCEELAEQFARIYRATVLWMGWSDLPPDAARICEVANPEPLKPLPPGTRIDLDICDDQVEALTEEAKRRYGDNPLGIFIVNGERKLDDDFDFDNHRGGKGWF